MGTLQMDTLQMDTLIHEKVNPHVIRRLFQYKSTFCRGNIFNATFYATPITRARVLKTAKTGFPLAIYFFLCSNAVERAVARLSTQPGTIVRVSWKLSM